MYYPHSNISGGYISLVLISIWWSRVESQSIRHFIQLHSRSVNFNVIKNPKFNDNSSKTDYFSNYTVNRGPGASWCVEWQRELVYFVFSSSLNVSCDSRGLYKLKCLSFCYIKRICDVNPQFTKHNGYSAWDKVLLTCSDLEAVTTPSCNRTFSTKSYQ